MKAFQCLLLVTSASGHGNTTKVAQAMADTLGTMVTAPESVPYTNLADCGLLGIGSGVYYGRMHRSLFDWLRGLPDDPTSGMPAFIFSTSGLPFLAVLWHWPLRYLLTRKGFRVVGEFACRGFDTWGPLWLAGGLNRAHPDSRDLTRARTFAAEMARRARVPGACPC